MNRKPKKMSAKEFREQGYLQELNRRFLHPLGLALEVVVEDGEITGFGEVWDSREDPEGYIYGRPADIDAAKANRIQIEELHKMAERFARFGWAIQPPIRPIPETEQKLQRIFDEASGALPQDAGALLNLIREIEDE